MIGEEVLRNVLPREEEEEAEPRWLFSGATRTAESLSKNLFTSRFGSYSASRRCFAPRQGDLYSTRVTWAV